MVEKDSGFRGGTWGCRGEDSGFRGDFGIRRGRVGLSRKGFPARILAFVRRIGVFVGKDLRFRG